MPVEALRKNTPRAVCPHTRWVKAISRSQRGLSSGRGRLPRIDAPKVASMFSPSTSRYVVPDPLPPSLMAGRYAWGMNAETKSGRGGPGGRGRLARVGHVDVAGVRY